MHYDGFTISCSCSAADASSFHTDDKKVLHGRYSCTTICTPSVMDGIMYEKQSLPAPTWRVWLNHNLYPSYMGVWVNIIYTPLTWRLWLNIIHAPPMESMVKPQSMPLLHGGYGLIIICIYPTWILWLNNNMYLSNMEGMV